MARKSKNGNVRMEDVARKARVSPITVSRALRSPQVVSKETRDRIAKAVAELRYVPNRVAGSLASNRSNIIAAIIPSIRYSALEGMVQGLADAARDRKVQLILVTSGDTLEGEEDAIEAVLAQRPDGICLHNSIHTARAKALLLASGIPVVETGDLLARPIDAAVSFSNANAAKAMTLHLAERGYQHIAFAGRAPSSSQRARDRLAGYEAALAQLGRRLDTELVLQVPGWMEGAAAALNGLLARRPEVDAVFFTSGNMAIGALLECSRRGWAVPARIAIAGFDDNELAGQVSPGLTTVRIPRYDIGRSAADYLMDRAAGERPSRRKIDLGFEIVQRGST